MDDLRRLLDNNRRWVTAMTRVDPEFFAKQVGKQEPNFLFIGCCDSRVPAEALTGARPGEMFVHRNIANQVYLADLNTQSVLQFAVEVLAVRHVIVCGHYECGGIRAAMGTEPLGLVDNWLGSVRNVMRLHGPELDAIVGAEARFQRLVDLNVLEQVYNLARTPVIQRAWRRGAAPLLHGLVYDLRDGLLHDLALGIDNYEKADALPRMGLRR